MALSFPNQTRFYDAPRRAVQFWGHDSTREAVFFVTEDALKRVQPGMRLDEPGLLGAFDANRELIHAAAAKVYARGRRGSYHLDSTDFQMVALLSAGFDGGDGTTTETWARTFPERPKGRRLHANNIDPFPRQS
jgi:hypothetical protein